MKQSFLVSLACMLASGPVLAMENDAAITMALEQEIASSHEKEYQLLTEIDNTGIQELKPAALEAIKVLIDGGVNINFQYADRLNQTPLMICIRHGKIEVFNLLLSAPGLNVRLKDANGMEAIHYCIEYNISDVLLKLLLTHRATLHPALDLNAPGREGTTPLYMAIAQDNLAQAELLCKESDINPNIPTAWGVFPLHAAAQHSSILFQRAAYIGSLSELMIRLLADKGALMNCINSSSQTPLSSTFGEIVISIMDAKMFGTNPFFDNSRMLALLALGASPTPAQTEYLKEMPSVLSTNRPLLLDMCVFTAVTQTEEALSKIHFYLANTPADPNKRDTVYGMTPLMWAAARGHLKLAKLLLTHPNIDACATDHLGDTALHYAARNGHLALVILLLRKTGIFVNQKNHNGKTALDLAKLHILEDADPAKQLSLQRICTALELHQKMMVHYFASVKSRGANCNVALLPADVAMLILHHLGKLHEADFLKLVKDATF